MTAPRLPRFWRRLASALAGRERRDEVVGDLEESWLRNRARRGAPGAVFRLLVELGGLAAWRIRGGVPGVGRAGADALADARLAVRGLVRRPGFALTAVAVLGIGIGAPTLVLSLVERIFLDRPAHVEAPDRLVRVYRGWSDGRVGGSLSHADYTYYRDGARSLEGLAAWSGSRSVAWAGDDGTTDQAEVRFVSPDYFRVLGVPMVRGRDFQRPEGTRPGEDPVVVVSHAFWERVLGGDPAAVGRTVRLSGVGFTVVGVAPEGFAGLSPLDAGTVDAWVPVALYGVLTRADDVAWWERHPQYVSNWLTVVGRLAPGATFAAAEAELTALQRTLAYEGKPDDEHLVVFRQVLYSPGTARQLASLSRLLGLAVLVVLLVAASNVTVLLLSRASTRGRELGIRAALGAGRGRLVRQMLVESGVLALAGGAVGLALATAGADLAGSLLPYRFAGGFAPDARVLGATVLLSLGTAVVVGLLPALGATRRDLAATMGDGRSAGGRSRLREGLVVIQVALSVVLVSSAFLFTRSFAAAAGQDLGFATADRLLVRVDPRGGGLDEAAARAFVAESLERLAALPGVAGVTTTRQVPFGGDWSTSLTPDPAAFPDASPDPVFLGLNAVSPHYFDVMGIPLLAGRPIAAADGQGRELVAVINRHLAESLWPSGGAQAAVGQVVAVDPERRFRVVGVAENARYYELGEDPVAQAYLAQEQIWMSPVSFVVRTAGDAPGLAGAARAAVRAARPDLAISEVTTLDAVFESETARYRVSAALVAVFGVFALVLAAVGLYGVVSFAVQSRTREIGVRMALGAPRAQVAGRVVRGALARGGGGIVVGLVLTLWARRFTESLVFGVAPLDPWSLAGGALVLLAVAAGAALVPARRAARVDPVEAMRVE